MTRRRHHLRSPYRPLAVVVLLLALILAACGRQAPAAPSLQSLPPDALHTLIDRTLNAPSADAQTLLLAALGEPQRREVESVPNRHEPARNDRVHALGYDSARAVVYEAVALGRSYLLELRVDADYLGPDGIGIGSERAAVVAAYGERLTVEGDALALTLTPAGDRLLIAFADGRVVRMVWQFYAG
jgi:hypothetical protein